MRVLTTLFLLLGMAILGAILYETDLTSTWGHVTTVGWLGIAAILVIAALEFLADVSSWLLTFSRATAARFTPRWLYEMSAVHLFSEALNTVTPFGSFGGEPIKAMVLNRHYGIRYREATATIVLARTINTVAMIVFVMVAAVLMFGTDVFPAAYRWGAVAGVAALTVGTLLFFLIQRYRFVSRVGRRIAGSALRERAQRVFDLIHDIEGHLISFYLERPWHFAGSFAFAMVNWLLGAVSISVVLDFLGHPVSFADAWLIEGIVLLVRSALFFVPANLGTQDGSLVVICAAITGSAPIGLAVALLRRFRELIWIVLGLAVGWAYSFRKDIADREIASRDVAAQPALE